ncbi:unnamed protein product [Prunus brigantina]
MHVYEIRAVNQSVLRLAYRSAPQKRFHRIHDPSDYSSPTWNPLDCPSLYLSFVGSFVFNMSTTLMYERRRRPIRDEQVLPEEIFFNIILARLPVKSLLQCRCLCQSWNTLIRSPDFISAHLETSVMRR